jgi:hypothetical protein
MNSSMLILFPCFEYYCTGGVYYEFSAGGLIIADTLCSLDTECLAGSAASSFNYTSLRIAHEEFVWYG